MTLLQESCAIYTCLGQWCDPLIALAWGEVSRFILQHSLNAIFVSPVPHAHKPLANFSSAGCQIIKSFPNAARLKMHRNIESTYFVYFSLTRRCTRSSSIARVPELLNVIDTSKVKRAKICAQRWKSFIYLFDIYSSLQAPFAKRAFFWPHCAKRRTIQFN